MTGASDILIVEDEPVVRAAARRLLTPEGFEVVEAEDLESALNLLAARSFGLVLSDLMLPGPSGFDVIAHVVRSCPRTPVAAITGYATTENALRVFALGAFDFVPKPFDWAELLGVVRRALRFFAAEAREAAPPPAGDRSGDRLDLGRHAWALLDEDGTATLGLAETFARVMGDREEIRLPEVGERLTQGKCMTRILTADGVAYRIWAPLSGKVLSSHFELLSNSAPLDSDPFGEGWLVRIIPDRLEAEVPLLQRRQGAGRGSTHRR